jgi:hypothetical protein
MTKRDVPDINVGNISKIPQLAIFDFMAFLNLGMLLVESESAKLIRQKIFNFFLNTIEFLS